MVTVDPSPNHRSDAIRPGPKPSERSRIFWIALRHGLGDGLGVLVVALDSAQRLDIVGAQGPTQLNVKGCRDATAFHRLRGLPRLGTRRKSRISIWKVVQQITIGPGAYFVNYFVASKRLVNFVGIIEQASWMEDGATLADCLRKIGDVPQALARYQELRLPRTSLVQSLAANNKIRFHLPDGPEQATRDAKMAAGGTDWSVETIGWLYGHDATAVAETGNLGLPPAA